MQRERDAPAEAESNIMERFLQTSGEFSTSPRGTRFSSGQVIPPLESIPTVFFEKDFDLGDPHIFALVTEQDEDSQNTVDPASLSYSLPLLEKLSHYADTIELHLIREISIRSSSFFAALTNLNDLQSESAQCLERIRKLRGMLTDIDTHSARKGIEAVRLECKLQNMGAVKEGTQIMQSVGEMFTAARSLANAGEWNEALGVVDNIHQLWEPSEVLKPTQTPQPRPSKGRSRPVSSYGQPSQRSSVQESPSEYSTSEPKRPLTLPLKTLTAFASLPEHLKALTLEIATSLTTELVTLLKTDLLVQLDRASHMNGGSPQDAPPPVLEKDPDAQISLSDQLKPLLLGLKRTNGLQDSVAKWREVALAEVRACVKRVRSCGFVIGFQYTRTDEKYSYYQPRTGLTMTNQPLPVKSTVIRREYSKEVPNVIRPEQLSTKQNRFEKPVTCDDTFRLYVPFPKDVWNTLIRDRRLANAKFRDIGTTER